VGASGLPSGTMVVEESEVEADVGIVDGSEERCD
jgi:hypothetical protein